jgi:hypothetical protein
MSRGSPGTDRPDLFFRRNRDKELFPEKSSGIARGLRDRSASPVKDRDGDAQMDLDESARVAAALRSREKGRSIKERLSKDNRTKELFPTKLGSVSGGKAQMDQVSDTAVLASGMSQLFLATKSQQCSSYGSLRASS